MTYYDDFSEYEYLPSDCPMVNIGWLDKWHEFPKGEVSDRIFGILLTLAQRQVNITRGVHDCEFCGEQSPLREPAPNDRGYVSLGMGEIHAEDASGRIYSAPSLILHYIREHGYCPPVEFLQAVERSQGSENIPGAQDPQAEAAWHRRPRGGRIGQMDDELSARQMEITPWDQLRVCGADSGTGIQDALEKLLHSRDSSDVQNAYDLLNRRVVPNGELYQCAAAMVAVIGASLAEGSVEPGNRLLVLRLLCLALRGAPAESEIVAGSANLDKLVHEEAMKAYWALLKLASQNREPDIAKIADENLRLLNSDHAKAFLGPLWRLESS